jgi:hypothetical protein
LALLAYVGGTTPLSQVQPYRHVGPLGLLALLPAAALLETAWREGWTREWPRSARRSVAALLVPLVLWCSQDVLYFTARSLPPPRPLPHGERVVFSAIGHIPPADYSYIDWTRDDLAQWIRDHDDGQGRFLVEGWATGEQLTWNTDAQILGGFIWHNVLHSWANLFRRRPQGIVQRDEFAQYVETYGVRWLVLSTPRSMAPWWDKNDLIELAVEIPPFRVFRIRPATHLLDPPQGHVQAATNVVRVTGTDPDTDVLLRYHWLPTLECRPGCRIVRQRVEHDPVGFFRVLAPHPADFEIHNAY